MSAKARGGERDGGTDAAECGCAVRKAPAGSRRAVGVDAEAAISSVQEALRGVGRELMRNHLRHCATGAIRTGGREADSMYDEIVDLMYTHNR